MAVTHQGTVAAFVESGRVLDVDISNYTLTIATQYSKKPQTGIAWSSPYTHFVNGEGMYIMPEVGSLCWVCFPSDGNRAFVLGWAPGGDEGDYRARRQDLNPGDIYMGTRDENFLILRRGGIVQIGGGPLSQRLFLPVNNTIKDFCENYGLHTVGGDLEWSVKREETDTDGKRPTTFSLKAREVANDEKPIAELLVGSHGDGDKTILSLKIKDSGASGAATQISLTLDKEGNVKWEVKKDVEWKVTGKYTLKADDVIEMTSKKDFKVKGKTYTLTGEDSVKIEATGGNVTITGSPKIIMKDKVEVGDSPESVALAGPLLQWLSMHTHNIIAPVPGTPTSPPMVPPLAPKKTAITSTTLKASA